MIFFGELPNSCDDWWPWKNWSYTWRNRRNPAWSVLKSKPTLAKSKPALAKSFERVYLDNTLLKTSMAIDNWTFWNNNFALKWSVKTANSVQYYHDPRIQDKLHINGAYCYRHIKFSFDSNTLLLYKLIWYEIDPLG